MILQETSLSISFNTSVSCGSIHLCHQRWLKWLKWLNQPPAFIRELGKINFNHQCQVVKLSNNVQKPTQRWLKYNRLTTLTTLTGASLKANRGGCCE